MKTTRRTFLGASAALAATAAMPRYVYAQEGTVLRVALSNPVIPRTAGNAAMGIEGRRFIDQTIYDPLFYYGVHPWSDPTKLTSYLATTFTVDPTDTKVWIIELRQGVKFHDGSDFDADAFIWNLQKRYDDSSPQFDKAESIGPSSVNALTAWEKRGSHTVAITTPKPAPFLPYSLGYLTMQSPARFAATGTWEQFALNPSGTGPFKLDYVDFQQRAELSRFDGYWDAERVPRVDKMIFTPIFEANTRTTALVSGQVDWIEAVAPDTVEVIKASGGQVVTNPYPQVWGYLLDCREGSPYSDIRVRKALSLGIDRAGMVQILNGLMLPAFGHYPEGHPWAGKPTFETKYDPEQAKALLAEAGYGPDKRIKSRVLAVAGGSGMMQPPVMNAFIQSNLAAIGVDLQIVTTDWNGLWGTLSKGAESELSQGCDMFNFSFATHDVSEPLRIYGSRFVTPNGLNWGHAKSERVDQLVDQMYSTFDTEEQSRVFAEFNAAVVDEVFSLYVAHDAFPRAFSARIGGFTEGYNGIRVQDPSFITVS